MHHAFTSKRRLKIKPVNVVLSCSINALLLHKQRRFHNLTQAGRRLPLDLRQFGDRVRAVALGEDCRQLLADYLILTKHRQKNKPSEREESCLCGGCWANTQEFMLRKNTSSCFSAPLLHRHPQHNYQHSKRGPNFCSLV